MKLKQILSLLLCLFFNFYSALNAQIISQAKPFFLGHSLVNLDMPRMVHSLALDAGKISNYDYQVINGATLIYQYQNPIGCQGTPYTTAFPNGNHDVFVLTEAVPLQNHLTWSNTYQYANNFINYANLNNNNLPFRYFLYETWHCINTGTPTECEWDNGDSLLWAPRLVSDFPLWTGILNNVRNSYPSNTVNLIPGGQAFYKLNQEIVAGNLPGITNFNQLFVDDIHLTLAGNYFIACVMYACIYKQSPVGLTNTMTNQWGVPYSNMPTVAQANIMQQVAWATVNELSSWTGVVSSPLSLDFLNESYNCKTNLLEWNTANEINADKFVVQISDDRFRWKDIATINANDVHTYKTILSEKLKFVRIKEVDKSSKFTYSNILQTQCNTNNTIQIFPTTTSNYCTIKTSDLKTKKYIVYDMLGKIVQSGITTKLNTVLDLSNLNNGIYIVTIINNNENVNFKIQKY